MAIVAKKYAQALYEETINSRSEKEVKNLTKKFIELLKKHDRLYEIESIIKHIVNLFNKSQKFSLNAEVEYANIDPGEKIKKLLNDIYDNKKRININSTKNIELIGGTRINFNGTLFDGSIKTYLNEIKKKTI